MTRTPPIFDLCGALPQGTTVLDASAGTGKTWTIAGLAARYLADGAASIDELMLVTFGRAATAELRERFRGRLLQTATALADPATARSSADELTRHLARGTDAEVDLRRQRLATAAANFDAATIATTHGFCHQMLAGLGIAADVDPDVTLTEATSDLLTDAASDLYVADYGRRDSPPPPTSFTFQAAAKVAADALGDRAARLEPADAHAQPEVAARYRFAERAREAVAQRKRAMRVMDYDDLLGHLRDALTDPQTGHDACARIQARYKVVLVDEFQDTDPVQWQILHRAFHGHRTLVLIGDPKQAIYAFRGADVVTYLLATQSATAEATLGTNWRSDRPLLDALRHLLGDVALGDPRIHVHPVAAAQQDSTLAGAPVDTPLRVRVVPRSEFNVPADKTIAVGDARPFIAADVAADIVRLLTSQAQLTHGLEQHRVQPADIAVLVHRNEDGRTVRDALAAANVPVVLLATTSVFQSPAASDWLTLLTALELPHRPGLTRAAALTDFLGWSAEKMATANDDELDVLSARLRNWADLLTRSGIAALLERITATSQLTERVLARQDGERDLTDLRHVGQALHEAATEGHGGTSSLVEWLQHRITEARNDVTEERSRRLDSDAKAVQILTIHRSKGLEYPIVYAPFLWDRWVPGTPDPLKLHDDTTARVLDIGGPQGPGYTDRKAIHLKEDAGESLRLAYVALTRARCQVVTYWAPSTNTATAPLHRLLFGQRTPDGMLPDRVRVPTDVQARTRLTEIVEASDGTICVEPARRTEPASLPAQTPTFPQLVARSLDRALDLKWSRTSYSGLTAGLHDQGRTPDVTSEPEAPGLADEPDVDAATPSAASIEADGGTWPQSPMADMPSGASFGTLVHAILEQVDFTTPDLRAHLTDTCANQGSQRFLSIPSADLADALLPALHTPLGPLADHHRLVDIAREDRLDELEFELPLAGGDTPTRAAAVSQIADLLRHHLPSHNPLAQYADDLTAPALTVPRLRGFLTGSIDAVLRIRTPQGTPRYLVVDYKTNRLSADDTLTAWHYRPEPMTRAMRDAHYPLQALLYSVALHRYLRWRQPGYDPGTHLGGTLYLFLRGMTGPDTPVVEGNPCGVFSWAPPPALVEDLSALLHRGGS